MIMEDYKSRRCEDELATKYELVTTALYGLVCFAAFAVIVITLFSLEVI
jgi:hypothetical protein